MHRRDTMDYSTVLNPAGTEITVFTFGTLQEGGRLKPMLDGCITDGPHWASVTGYDLYSNTSISYPYLLQSEDPTAKVYGSLYRLAVGAPEFERVHRMEVGCGYVPTPVTVTRQDTGEEVTAMAYLWTTRRDLGPHIPEGQWVQWSRANEDLRFRTWAREDNEADAAFRASAGKAAV